MGNTNEYEKPPKDGVSFLLSQPEDVLILICSYLSHVAISRLERSSSILQRTISTSDDLWNFFLQRDFQEELENEDRILCLSQRDKSKDTLVPKEQYKRLVLLQSPNWLPKTENAHVVAHHFVVQNKLRAPKGVRLKINKERVESMIKGPITTSLLLLGCHGVGISSLIAYIINKHPYNMHSKEGQPPTAAAAWYKNCCIALQRCGVEEAELILSQQKRKMDGPFQKSQIRLMNGFIEYTNMLNFEHIPVCTIVVVVDSSRQKMDQLERLKESFSKIHELITSNTRCNPKEPNILVLAHKQDIIDCISVKEISEVLNLEDERYKSINWAILPTSTKIPGSIESALDWIVEFSYKFDSTRVDDSRRSACCMVV